MKLEEITLGQRYVWLTPLRKQRPRKDRLKYLFWPASVDAEAVAITKMRVRIRFKVDGQTYTRSVDPANLFDWLDEEGNIKP